jgi:hypothetical protein
MAGAMDLNTIANVSTAVAVAMALVFGVIQVRQANRKRADSLVLEALRFAQSPELSRAMALVLELPEGMTLEQLAAQPKEVREAVALVDYTLETLGWMVHRRMVPLRDLDDLMGGVIRAAWKRLHRVAEERRALAGRPNEFEWLQWLDERLEENPNPAKPAGLHVSYKDWRP